jgi:hypothetical protein
VNGAARASPRRVVEVRETVNDTLRARDLAIPCRTHCGAAQPHFTDGLPECVDTAGHDLGSYQAFWFA